MHFFFVFVESTGHFNNLNVTVTGEPRKSSVLVPRSVQGSKPGAVSNDRVSFFIFCHVILSRKFNLRERSGEE